MRGSFEVLVVDDDPSMRDACRQALSRPGCSVRVASCAEEALSALARRRADVVVLDMKLPRTDGIDLLARIRERWPSAVVVMVTGYATIPAAVEAMRRGAFDFIPKPFSPNILRSVVARALQAAGAARGGVAGGGPERGEEQPAQSASVDDIIGESPAIKQVKELILRAAPTDSTVLVTGESGTGKELVARALHAHSRRRGGPLVTVDCASLVDSLAGSELFGHVRGAFTDAHADRRGWFEAAQGGTLFFDEVGVLRPQTQAKLLRALQEKVVYRVGSCEPIAVDVRVVAATNVDLAEEVRRGTFREDLYFRLNVVPIYLPPLRERPEDVVPLAEHFLRRWSREEGVEPPALAEDAVEFLRSYSWPGNVRELENMIERAVVLAEGALIRAEDLRSCGAQSRQEVACDPHRALRLEEVEREHISRVLARFAGNRTKAARALGIDRKTLQRKMAKYNIVA